jgi:hypothetical protein
MKYFTSLLFLFYASLGYTQYDSLVVNDAHWFVGSNHIIYPYDYLWEYHINGDTMINTTTYKKVYKRDLQSINNNFQAPYHVLNETYSGALREDTTSKKVYAIHPSQVIGCAPANQEYILFDFSLGVDDSIYLCNHYSPPDSVDYTFFGSFWTYNGPSIPNRKVTVTKMGMEYGEGLGSYQGLFEAVGIALSGTHTFLYNYCRGSSANCGVVYLGVEENNSNPLFSVFPNPSSNIFNLGLVDSQFKSITIYNSLGQIVRHLTANSSQVSLDLTSDPKGLYTIHAVDFEGTTFRKKIIKR